MSVRLKALEVDAGVAEWCIVLVGPFGTGWLQVGLTPKSSVALSAVDWERVGVHPPVQSKTRVDTSHA